jgi:glycosyltransferase involved in cell wall biosynthesis
VRIGTLHPQSPNGHYRAIYPLWALEQCGHEVVRMPDPFGPDDVQKLASCDVFYVYRMFTEIVRQISDGLRKIGVPTVYDNDDDLSAVPRSSTSYAELGGARGGQIFKQTVAVARGADTMTTPSAYLAERYRAAGVDRVEVIENHLHPSYLRRARSLPHRGVTIGWVAAGEHREELVQLDLREALGRVLAAYPAARVETIGVDLGLGEKRCRHTLSVPFATLPARVARFDIGIAPLSDIPFNRARSNIKLKEYAGAGVAWLASPVGPYQGMGEAQGGRLVADDGWSEAIAELVERRELRRELARRGAAWAHEETVDRHAERWEAVFTAAVGRSRSHPVTL